MKKSAVLGIVIVLFLVSQTSIKAQMLRFGISGGITSITSPNTYTNSVEENGYGFSTNFHLGAQVRVDLPLVPITPIVFVDYHLLRGDGNRNGIQINNSQDILSIGVEGEYYILPLPFIKPYISLDVALNKIGELKEKSQLSTGTQPGYSRFGGGIGIGTVVTILPVVDLDVSLKYETLNLVGKNSNESNISLVNFNVAVIF